MGIKALAAFDHMGINSARAYCGMDFKGNAYGAISIALAADQRPRIRNKGLYSAIQFPFGNIGLDFRKKIIIGFRHQPDSPSVVGFGLSQGFDSGGYLPINYTCNDLKQVGDAYVEAVFDFVGNKVSFYVDGNKTLETSYAPALMAEFKTTYAWFFFYGNNADWSSYVTDILIRDEGPDETIAPWGNVKFYPITTVNAVAEGWTPPSGKSLTESLNTLSVAGSETTPVIRFPQGTTPVPPIVTNLTHSASAVKSVTAVSFLSSMQDTGTSVKTMIPTLTQNGVNKNGTSVLMTAAMAPGKQLGIFPTAPDGTAWTLDKIKSATLTLTPT